jgi:anion-transporting  ArsA/GET3 family ATPase
MTQIDVFDPPMCCSTGACGPAVDPLLAAFSADLQWLAAQGVRVTRHNLAQASAAFAAFDQFTQWLTAPGTADAYHHVVFDTAPTGHTLRLSTLPAAWDTFITSNTTGTSCLGPLSGLQAQHATYRASLDALRDPHQATVVLVRRPDAGALAEAERTRGELAALGVRHQRLVVNAVFRASEPSDIVAAALEARGRHAPSQTPAALAALPPLDVPMLDFAPLGVLPRLRDPRYTRVLIVTLPEATPVHEAAALQDDLRRAGIEPFAWVVNQSLAAEPVRDPVLCARAAREAPYLAQVRDRLATTVARVPWMPEPPVGRDRLRQLAGATPVGHAH